MLDFSEMANKIYGKPRNAKPEMSEDEKLRSEFTPQNAMDIAAPTIPEEEADYYLAPQKSDLPFTKEGEESAKWYADKYLETGDLRYAAGGLLASLWTPQTAEATASILAISEGIGSYLGRNFYNYSGASSPPKRLWATRDWGNKPPYGEDFEKAADKLQLPNKPTKVQKLDISPFEPLRGPRRVEKNESFGAGGGVEYYRGWGFPPEP